MTALGEQPESVSKQNQELCSQKENMKVEENFEFSALLV